MPKSSIKNIDKIMKLLKEEIKPFENPVATEIGEKTKDPFLVLISCILSLRTKDTTTGPASKRLFELADNPYDMVKLTKKQIERAIFPVGFYPTKAKYIKKTCKILVEKYNGKVPDKEDELLKLPGIGRKCMSITMCYGFFKLGYLAIDTHCHRIPNRLGWISTKTPLQTEGELRKILPKGYWKDFNDIFVTFGQNVCLPISPFCSRCAINSYCPKIGVTRSR
ncbi:MAG: endonuclease III [Nanoarchaeota archaeon]